MIQILNPDLTPMQDVQIAPFEAGQDSGIVPFAIQNAGPDVVDVADVLVVLQVLDPTTGQWVSSGVPPADELWGRLRLTGQDATLAPGQFLEITDWLPVGAWRSLPIRMLLSGGIRHGEFKLRPPATAASLTWSFRLAVLAAEHAYPVPPGTRQGILTGLGDRGHSTLLKGFQVTTSVPPDDQVHIAAGHLIYRGDLVGHVATTLALSQEDADATPLAPGTSYLAVLSIGPTGLTITKGQQAPVPFRPPAPPWEPVLAVLAVHYQSSGTTEIDSTHFTDLRLFDRYQAEPGTGLHLRLHPGRAIAGGTLRYHSTPTDLLLPPNQTTHLWQRANGAWELTTPTAPPPETTALGPLWLATTDAATVIALQDRRAYAADAVVLHLRGPLPSTPGPIADLLILQDGLILEDVLYRLSDSGGGESGQTQLDLHLDGTTLYPSHAQDDHRPTWPHDAADLIHQGTIHEITDLSSGQRIELVSLDHPTNGIPAWAEAYLLCRRP